VGAAIERVLVRCHLIFMSTTVLRSSLLVVVSQFTWHPIPCVRQSDHIIGEPFEDSIAEFMLKVFGHGDDAILCLSLMH